MLLIPYAEQLRMMAEREKVDLVDAVRHAGVNYATYWRSISSGRQQLRLDTAEAIAAAIKDLGVGA